MTSESHRAGCRCVFVDARMHTWPDGRQVCMRINPDVEAGEHVIVRTGTVDCKFGIAVDHFADVRAVPSYVRDLCLESGSGVVYRLQCLFVGRA